MNRETEAVSRLLRQRNIWPKFVTLVIEWNKAELLGIDLADSIRNFVEGMTPDLDWSEVDWAQLAEQYAWRLQGVTEKTLTARREATQLTRRR